MPLLRYIQRLIIVLPLLQLISISLYADTIRLRSDAWCPYTCDPTSTTPGFLIEIAREVFKKSGHTIDYKTLNWARAIEEARNGSIDGVVGGYKSDTLDFIFPKEPQCLAYFALFTNASDTFSYKDQKSLTAKKIGVINGYSYDEITDQAIKEKNKSYVIVAGERASEQLIKMLQAKRIDAYYENPIVFEHQLSLLGLKSSEFKNAGGPPQQNTECYIAFSPKNPKAKLYAEILSTGMLDLRRNGTLKKILEHYHIEDWKVKSN